MARGRKKKKPGPYSADERAKALAAIVANGGNVSRTAVQLKISKDSLRRWLKEESQAEVSVAVVQKTQDTKTGLDAIASMLLKAMPEKITDAPLNQLTSTLVAIEKLQLFHAGQLNCETDPINLSKRTNEQLEQLEQLTTLLLRDSPSSVVHFLNAQVRAMRVVRMAPLLSPLEWNRHFLPHHFTPKKETEVGHNSLDIPELHSWFAEKLCNLHDRRSSRLAVIAPRESAKSTWITLAYVLRCAVENREPYILLLSDSEDQAEKFLAAIKAELEQSAGEPCSASGAVNNLNQSADESYSADEVVNNLNQSVGEPCSASGVSDSKSIATLATAYPDACGEGPEWRSDRIRLKNGVVIESLGRGSKIRGRKDRQHRPTLIVIDDCQSNRDIVSSTERQKTLNWFMQEVIPCGSESTNFISVGSALHRDAIAVRAQSLPGWVNCTFSAIVTWPDRMDLWQEWELQAMNLADADRSKTAANYYAVNKAEMDRGGVSFWPSYKPVSALIMKRAEIGPRRFLTEYQGISATPDGAEWPPEYFDRSDLWFTRWPTDIVHTIIAIDPSKGRTDKPGDYQAHAVISLTRDGKLWVDCECHREPVPEMVVRAVELARIYHPHSLVVETNQGLDLLIPEFERSALASKLLIPLENVEHYGESKVARIRRLGSYLSRGQIRIRNSTGGRMLMDQLRDFPNGDHDDAPDALELGIRRLELLTAGR